MINEHLGHEPPVTQSLKVPGGLELKHLDEQGSFTATSRSSWSSTSVCPLTSMEKPFIVQPKEKGVKAKMGLHSILRAHDKGVINRLSFKYGS